MGSNRFILPLNPLPILNTVFGQTRINIRLGGASYLEWSLTLIPEIFIVSKPYAKNQ